MRILVFSDTHGMIDNCISTISRIGAVDMLIHAGDVSSDAEDLQSIFPNIPVKYVCGNCELPRAPLDVVFDAGGKKFFVTHGHAYNVKGDREYRLLTTHAKEIGADIAVFGHTHNALCNNDGSLILLNPGSVRYGRTYGVVEIENDAMRAAVLDF